MTQAQRDLVVARVVRSIAVPHHAVDFWDRLELRLAPQNEARLSAVDDDGDEAVPVVPLQPPTPRASMRRRLLVPAAALVVVIGAGALALVADTDGVQVTPATAPADSTAPATRPAEPASPPGSEEAVLSFLDALGRGDLDRAASRLGPRSEAYLEATAGSVESFLRVAEEGYGAWAASEDRETRVIELRPGDVVVFVSGRLTVEGSVEHRHDAFPARYAQSAGAWFVEPWALDPATDARLEWHVADRGDEIKATTPAAGTAWLAVNGEPLRKADVGADRRAVWRLSRPYRADDLVMVAFINDTTFVAATRPHPSRSR